MTYHTLTPEMQDAAARINSSAARLRMTLSASFITEASAERITALLSDLETATHDLKSLAHALVARWA
jgi:hypothetical protein